MIFTTKRGIEMGEVIRKFMQLNGKMATVILEHCWFERQRFTTQEVNVFEDGDRLGLVLRGQEVYVYKHRLKLMELHDHLVEFADDRLKISINF